MTTLFNVSWTPHHEEVPKTKKSNYKELREWQKEAYYDLLFKRYMTLNAPTGSGKSLLIEALSWAKMSKDKKLRVAISAPQTIIGNNFAENSFTLPDTGGKADWVTANNLCSASRFTPGGTASEVIDWLKSRQGFFQDRVLIACNQTWVAVFNRLRDEGNLHFFDNLLFWCDEAHHLKNSLMENEWGITYIDSNGIGGVVHYLATASQACNIQVGIVSATLFRSDTMALLAGEAKERFNGEQGGQYTLDWPRYLAEMKYLKSITFDFVLCGANYADAFKEILREKHKDIVYIPHPLSKASMGDKYMESDSVINEYQIAYNGNQRITANGTMVFECADGKTIILNLVDEDKREEKKEYIREKINGSRDALDAIIAIGMFKEGGDWIYADRSIIVGARTSTVDVFQIIGRLLRDVQGKEKVQIIQLLPFSLDRLMLTEEEFRQNLNDFLKFVFASILIENTIKPIEIKSPKGQRQRASPKEKDNLLTSDEMVDLRDKASNILQSLSFHDDDNLWASGEGFKIYESRIATILREEHNITALDEVKSIAKEIWDSYARKTFEDKGIDLSDVPYDIVKKTNPLGFLLRFTTGACGVSTWIQLRDALRAKGKGGVEPPWVRVEEASLGSVSLSKVAGLSEEEKKEVNEAL